MKNGIQYTYPGKTCEEKKAVGDMHTKLDPSHVIVHCGTNNLVTDSADVTCSSKIEDLAENIQSKFPNAKLGVSGLTYREDVKINHIRVDVN